MEDLDLPSQRIPFEFLDRIPARLHRKIGQEFPFNLLSVLWRSSFISVDHCQSQSWIPRLLAYGWQNTDSTIPDFKNGLVWIALAILDFDPVETFDHDLVHYRCNGMIAIACQAIDTGPYQECRAGVW
ncbi:hypothetical protein [Bradyrhizobium yuanmingense]|uniref:hypothetical protein n=1 Tax=Bradyrhizobium yuanmingense TaxID=108015 RepID=UPI001CD6B7B4|nr:hypothetical protein [Bradyrhizobium yuanmingense]MCA1530605.1 hypothetical protein [Bradyrhizobium yuanmingense]